MRSASGAGVAEPAFALLTSDISGNKVVELRLGIDWCQRITTEKSKHPDSYSIGTEARKSLA
jgi:hypothetical protein